MSSLVLPIHNEAEMLLYTLPSIYALHAKEVIFGLDRCDDYSEKIIRAEAKKYPKTATKLVEMNDASAYQYRPAYLRRRLYDLAENDTILNTSADVQLDQAIKHHLKLDRYKLISFGDIDYPFNYQCFAKRLLSVTGHGFSGLMVFSKAAYLETEDVNSLKNIKSAEDTHLYASIASKYPTRHINTRSLHLRPREMPTDHWKRGYAQRKTQHKSQIQSFIHSIIMLRPNVFVGYRHALRGD